MNDETRSIIAKFILGLDENIEITGAPMNVAIIAEAIQSSKELFKALEKNESIRIIQKCLDRKRVAVERWKNLTGEKWLL